MGRKKIEIRPLTDERNRNVTFLKRKAGLMKKAWELSVLCAADVSIMIFSSQGKAYEFSSKDLDAEIDKYLDYEGLIERRRAEEFAAMAAAGEDDDDDEDEPPRRGSVSKGGAANATGAPTKSLKGKESFKARQPSRSEIGRAVARAKEGKRGKRDKRSKRRRDVDDRGGRSFIDGLLSDEDSSDDESERDPREREREDRKRRRRDDAHHPAESDQPPQGIAGLNYALSMHQPPPPMAEGEQLGGLFAHTQPGLATRSNYRLGAQLPAPNAMSNPYDPYPVVGMSGMADPQMSYHGGSGHAPHNPTHLPGNMQWDPQLVARFAEFQMQQNHQKQQRVLLERQRAQLAEMGIPIDDRTLLDQIFGNGPANAVSPLPPAEGHEGGGGGGGGGGGFEWPSVSRRAEDAAPKDDLQDAHAHAHAHAHPHGHVHANGNGNGGPQGGYGYPHYASASTSGSEGDRRYEAEHIPWGVGGGGVPTPDSPSREKRRVDEGLYDAAMEERRRRTVLRLPM